MQFLGRVYMLRSKLDANGIVNIVPWPDFLSKDHIIPFCVHKKWLVGVQKWINEIDTVKSLTQEQEDFGCLGDVSLW